MLPVEISIVIKMEQLKFETSMKNIPLGGNKEYVMQLTQSVRKVVYAMSWALLTSVAEDPSGATVCTTQWNKNQSCYTSCIISS